MTTISAEQVSFSYPTESVLHNCDFTIPEHELSLLIGPTGSGKSTLLLLLAKLIKPQTGRISPQPASFMFQNPRQQFAMNTPLDQFIFIMENRQLTAQTAWPKIKAVSQQLRLSALLHQPLRTLSGGQLQRVALAAALLLERDILLLDEPFASVDPESRHFMLGLLHKLQEAGKTILIIDHDLSGYEQICQHVFQLKNQQISELSAVQKQQLWHEVPQHQQKFALPKQTAGLFQLQNFSLQRGQQLLIKQPQLFIPANAAILLTGSNGSGKSSLLQALSKLLPYQGHCLYHGRDISRWRRRRFFAEVGQVFQTASDQFLTVTVAEELELSAKQGKCSAAIIQQMLADFNLQNYLQHSPYLLSGGQQKLVQLLTMLIMGRPVLLLDEPLAGLDQVMIKQVAKWLAWSQAHFGQTQLIVSHQAGLNQLCRYHLRLTDGQLSFQEAGQ
jgi:energy-coupling factor transport system ATP-binding protein